MRFFVRLVTVIVGLGIVAVALRLDSRSQLSVVVSAQSPSSTPHVQRDLRSVVGNSSQAALIGVVVVAVIVLAGGLAMMVRGPRVLELGSPFFFWLGLSYTGLLLLIGLTYDLSVPAASRPLLLGGILPAAVPWFGALGAVTISMEGVFLWNQQWDSKFNFWHIGRPLFGAVLGIVAFFIFVVIVSASGTPPKFLESGGASGTAAAKDYIVFYVVAFLVGYREETFRELIKRATDLILKPGTTAAASPAVTFKVGGAIVQQIQCQHPVAPAASTTVTVEIMNSGTVPITAPVLSIASTPAGVFSTANDHVSGSDLPPGQSRTVDVACTPGANAAPLSGTLTLKAANLTTPKTIPVTA